MPSAGKPSTGVPSRRSPSRSVPARPARSAPVAVLSCCTTLSVHHRPHTLRYLPGVPARRLVPLREVASLRPYGSRHRGADGHRSLERVRTQIPDGDHAALKPDCVPMISQSLDPVRTGMLRSPAEGNGGPPPRCRIDFGASITSSWHPQASPRRPSQGQRILGALRVGTRPRPSALRTEARRGGAGGAGGACRPFNLRERVALTVHAPSPVAWILTLTCMLPPPSTPSEGSGRPGVPAVAVTEHPSGPAWTCSSGRLAFCQHPDDGSVSTGDFTSRRLFMATATASSLIPSSAVYMSCIGMSLLIAGQSWLAT
jgi:hypothetical protein